MPSIDPIYQQQQQQYFYNKGLERAKRAQRERKNSRVKLWLVLVIVFVLAVAAVFVLGGGLGSFSYHHVKVDGIIYRIGTETVISLDKEFDEAGDLSYAEDWKHSAENFATDWRAESRVYVNPNDRSKVYIRWQGHYLKCPRERNIFLK